MITTYILFFSKQPPNQQITPIITQFMNIFNKFWSTIKRKETSKHQKESISCSQNQTQVNNEPFDQENLINQNEIQMKMCFYSNEVVVGEITVQLKRQLLPQFSLDGELSRVETKLYNKSLSEKSLHSHIYNNKTMIQNQQTISNKIIKSPDQGTNWKDQKDIDDAIDIGFEEECKLNIQAAIECFIQSGQKLKKQIRKRKTYKNSTLGALNRMIRPKIHKHSRRFGQIYKRTLFYNENRQLFLKRTGLKSVFLIKNQQKWVDNLISVYRRIKTHNRKQLIKMERFLKQNQQNKLVELLVQIAEFYRTAGLEGFSDPNGCQIIKKAGFFLKFYWKVARIEYNVIQAFRNMLRLD